jgi:ferric-dicitrate binding protein FerR (iron transport regulator)
MKDKYLSYNTQELVADDEFISWILEPTEAKTRQWTTWLENHPQVKPNIEEATDIVKNISFKKIDTGISTTDLWNKIDNELNVSKKSKNPARIRNLIISTAVAAGLTLFLIMRVLNDGQVTIKSDPSIAVTHQLPDGSQVIINDGSKISYDKKSFVNSRTISLNGEAFFEVQKGNSFIVNTPSGSIEVLGTSFNVFSHDNRLRVYCKTGSVKVKAPGSEVVLKPGEKTSLLENNTLNSPELTDEDVSWLQGLYNFENAPLLEVAAELERQFNIKIKLNSTLSKVKYTGFFQDSDLEEALHSVCWPLKLKANKQAGSTYEIISAD